MKVRKATRVGGLDIFVPLTKGRARVVDSDALPACTPHVGGQTSAGAINIEQSPDVHRLSLDDG